MVEFFVLIISCQENWMRRLNCFLCGVLAALLTAGCGRTPNGSDRDARGGVTEPFHESSVDSPPWFVDEAAPRGLDFVYASGHEARFLFPEIMGGGVALLDFDNDGVLDIYCVDGGALAPETRGGNSRLFKNIQGRFLDVTEQANAGNPGYGMGVAAADFDNDGHVDLYITNVGKNRLLRNDGQGQFHDVTDLAGVGDTGWGTSAAFIDFDQDGHLDLFVCNYVVWTLEKDLECYSPGGQPDYCSPNSYNAPQPDVLYRNLGDGTFEDVSERAGIRAAFGNGLGVVCGDFNGDGWPDIFVANDGMPNQLWINRGDGTFEDQAMLLGCAIDKDGIAKAGMGTCAVDLDGDGDLDLLVVNLQAQSDSYFRNQGGHFVDDTARIGLGTATRPYTRFGVGWIDFNNNGKFDLFQANGRVTLPDHYAGQDPFAEPNILLVGKGDRFLAAPQGSLPSTSRTSRAAAFGDLNNDGLIDIVVINRDAPAELLMNAMPSPGNWLILKVTNQFGRDDIGAMVRFQLGNTWVRRDVNPHYSYLASNDSRVHLGLGDLDRVDAIEVHWVDGSVEQFPGLEANQIAELVAGLGTAIQPPTPRQTAVRPLNGPVCENLRDPAPAEFAL